MKFSISMCSDPETAEPIVLAFQAIRFKVCKGYLRGSINQLRRRCRSQLDFNNIVSILTSNVLTNFDC